VCRERGAFQDGRPRAPGCLALPRFLPGDDGRVGTVNEPGTTPACQRPLPGNSFQSNCRHTDFQSAAKNELYR